MAHINIAYTIVMNFKYTQKWFSSASVVDSLAEI